MVKLVDTPDLGSGAVRCVGSSPILGNMSFYITSREPYRFGGQQLDYIEQSQAIVFETVGKIKQAVHSKKDLTQLFHELLSDLGNARNQIAVNHGTKASEDFGCRRDGLPFSMPGCYTPLIGCYEEYHQRPLSYLQSLLANMKYNLREFQQKKLKIEEKTCLGKESSLELEIFSVENTNEWGIFPSKEEYERLCQICEISILKNPFEFEFFKNLLKDKDFCLKLKERSLEDYKKIKLCNTIVDLKKINAEKKSDWILATRRLKINDKMYALSHYLTWAYRDFKSDPIEQMTHRSVVAIQHEDSFLIGPVLNDVAEIFKRAIEWNKENISSLQENIALFLYEMSNVMPFKRGSAAILEWFEMAIYRYHDMWITYHPKYLVNLEALTLPLAEFVRTYPSMISYTSS